MRLKILIIGLLILVSGIFYYEITGSVVKGEEYYVTRVIDGDTFEIETGQKFRLIGINTPEKLMPYGKEAEIFLRNQVENKTVNIENYGFDKYNRVLAHVFLGDLHINSEILREGLATLYYYEEDYYYEELKKSEEFARNNKKNLWKESTNKKCIELVELKYIEEGERCTDGEKLVIKNLCDKNIKFIFKDDATHIYYEILKPREVLNKNFSCIWNDDGDSLYIFDEEGMILFYRYY